MKEPLRIAMWSGPRSHSTAVMRSFGARADTAVVDEPFYAAFLAQTGAAHPMRDQVIAAGPVEAEQVIAGLLGPLPADKRVLYQKHMTHHMLPKFDRSWFDSVEHAFLIRRPSDVVASYETMRDGVRLEDIGIAQQVEIFDHIKARTGRVPPVVDAADILAAPEETLAQLCKALGLHFDQAMLKWPPGLRTTDGVWAVHWYGAVERSNGFAAAAKPNETSHLSPAGQAVSDSARPFYDHLAAHRITPKGTA